MQPKTIAVTQELTYSSPDERPRTEDGDLLRERLFAWLGRNQEFMRTDGRGELPLKP